MIKFTLTVFLSNLIVVYFFLIGDIFEKILKLKFSTIFKILFGYSIFSLLSFYLFFFLKLELLYINIFFLVLFLVLLLKIKNYFSYFFFKRENLFFNITLIIFLILAFLYGEQFYIFRGNYWDSSNYLSSALLFKNFSYSDVQLNNYSIIYNEFTNMKSIVTSRPAVNYLLSLFLNFEYSIFYVYYFFKCFLSGFIYLALIDLFKNTFKDLKKIQIYVLSSAFIFSFWSLYILEIDALSHLASIPILILLVQKIFHLFRYSNTKKDCFILIVLSSSLFIIYPEIIIVPLIFFLTLIICNIKTLNKNFLIYLMVSFFLFILITLPAYETNYKFLLSSQLSQMTRNNDWWGYFGSFLLGKENLVLDQSFVLEIKLLLSKLNFQELVKYLHDKHFSSAYYFIYLNILPSLSGLYFITPGKVDNNFEILIQIIIITSLCAYLILIISKNLRTLISNKYNKNFLIIFFTILLTFIIYFFLKKSFWTLIKIYTYFFPFIYIFFALDLKSLKINKFYVILAASFFLYKFSTFNDGIARYDSFPSIINPYYKSEVTWHHKDYDEFENCKSISLNKDDYILNTYLNLKVLNTNKIIQNKKNCKIMLKNKKFEINYE